MTHSMTEGRPFPLLIQFFLPLLAANLVQQTYNMVDAAIVGRILGANALAGVGASSSVQFLVLGFCIGICAGFMIPVAREFGAGNLPNMRKFIWNTAILAAAAAALVTAVCSLETARILRLLQTPADIFENAYAYLLIIFLGIPFTFAYNTLGGILRAVGDSRTPFLVLLFSSVLNVGLDLFCISILHLGCAGAALATIFSQALSAALCFIIILRRFPELHIRKEEQHFSSGIAGELLGMGLPMGLQYSVTAVGSMIMQSANNSLGSVYVSGFTAGTKIKQFTICPNDALGTAVSTFVSQNLGAGKPDRIKAGIRDGLLILVPYGIIAGAGIFFFGRQLSGLFLTGSGNDAVLDAAARYLAALGLFYWVLSMLNVFRFAVQGMGFPKRAIFGGLLEMISRSAVSIFLVPRWGYNAICIADQTAWITCTTYIGITCFLCYRKVSAALKQQQRKEGSHEA